MKPILFALLVVAAFAGVMAWGFHKDHDESVLLTDIDVLTFRKGEWTTARRSRAVPQLKCVGGDAKNKYEPSVVQCRNMGHDGTGNVQWKCEAEMESDYKLGTTDVSCEGYRDKHDPYILRGSCGLEYTLEYTAAGKEHLRSGSRSRHASHEYTRQTIDASRFINQPESDNVGSWRKKLGQVAVLAVVGIALFGICCGTLFRGTVRTVRNAMGGHGHTTTAGPRVPMSSAPRSGGFYPAPPTMGSGYTPSAPSFHDVDDSAKYGASQSRSSGPGFGTGLAAGAAAGYLASRVLNRSSDSSATAQRQSSPTYVTAPAPAPSTHITTGYGETKKR